jgi:hypothetical protein
VFVDDSGRRRRIARIAGIATGGLALAYLAIVGATFAGVPGLGRLGPPGVGQLTNPAGDQADVGSHPTEQVVPEAVANPADSEAIGPTTTDGLSPRTEATWPTSTAPSTTTTTTTTVHGSGTPNSTVPDRGGGPPTSHPQHP